jgi:ferredoxin--NADP+ reductase
LPRRPKALDCRQSLSRPGAANPIGEGKGKFMTVISEKHQKVKVVARRDYAKDLWSLRVQPEAQLSFKPGQYTTLGVQENGKVLERAYSIVSSPLENEVEFFFELVPHGELTPHLYYAKEGSEFLMRRQAKGLFTLDTESGHRQHLLVATVTGVAPYVSMVRTAARQANQGQLPDYRMVLIQSASRSWEFAYREELQALAEQHSWLEYIPTVSRPWEDAEWTGEVGRAEDILRKYLDNLGLEPATTTAYACGHPQMIENAKGILARRGFSKEFVREEGYWVPKKEHK